MTLDPKGLERELRERAEWRAENDGPFTKENLIEWRAAEFLSALSKEVQASEVVVKPLEWRDEPIPPSWECLASTGVGLYCIPLGRQIFELRFRDKYTLGEFDNLDAAKAAAQSHFETAVASCLATPQPLPAPDRGAVKALCDLTTRAENFWAFIQGEYGVRLDSESRDDHNVYEFFSALETANAVLSAAALSVPAPGTGEAREVAWRWKDGDDRWQCTADEDRASYAFRVEGYDVQPLFDAPALFALSPSTPMGEGKQP